MTANDIVREHFYRKSRKGYSLRAFARDLKVSPAFVSNLFQGKRKVPLKLLPRIAKILDIDAETVTEIKRQILPSEASQTTIFRKPSAAVEWRIADPKKMSAMKQWFYVPIMELCGSKDFDGQAATIARRLSLALPTVEVALRDLCAAGVLKMSGGKIVKIYDKQRVASSISRKEIRDFHHQLMCRAQEALKNADDKAFAARLITGITVTADPEKIAVAKKMLNDALHEIANYLTESSGSEVYHIAAQLFPLTNNP